MTRRVSRVEQFFLLLLFLLGGGALFADGFSVAASTSRPVADGTIGAGEYQAGMAVGPMMLYASLGTDGTLFVAARSPRQGWISVGLGSDRMNGSVIFIGTVKDGNASIKVQRGNAFHGHADTAEIAPLASRVARNADGTVIEFSVPVRAFLVNGTVPLIVGTADQNDFVTRHAFRGVASLGVR